MGCASRCFAAEDACDDVVDYAVKVELRHVVVVMSEALGEYTVDGRVGQRCKKVPGQNLVSEQCCRLRFE